MLETTTKVHTPSTLVNVFASTLKTTEESSVLLISGVYKRKGNKIYSNGYAYDELLEETSQASMTLQVPSKLRIALRNNYPYILKGSLHKKPTTKGQIELQFVLADIEEELDPRFTEVDIRVARLIREKGNIGYKNVGQILRNKLYAEKKPQLVLFIGIQGIIDADVLTAVGEAASYYELIFKRLSLTAPQQLTYALQKVSGDVIAVVHGGGSELEVFDEPDILEAALNLKVPFIVALGHAQDTPLLEQIADQVLTTPTALGTYLKNLVGEVEEERLNNKAVMLRQVENLYKGKLEQKEFQLERLTRNNERIGIENRDLQEKVKKSLKREDAFMVFVFGILVASLAMWLLR